MTTEGVQPMRIRSGDQRFLEFFRDTAGAPIRIERAFVKMTKLDGVEAIDLVEQTFPDGATKNVKGMWRENKNGIAAARA